MENGGLRNTFCGVEDSSENLVLLNHFDARLPESLQRRVSVETETARDNVWAGLPGSSCSRIDRRSLGHGQLVPYRGWGAIRL